MRQDEKNGRLKGLMTGESPRIRGGTGVLEGQAGVRSGSLWHSRLQKPTVLCSAKETLIDG